MATKVLKFSDIKSGWYISYFFMTEADYGYTATIHDDNTTYKSWTKPDEGAGTLHRHADTFQYTGSDGALKCTVECPDSNRLDNSWNEGTIQPSSGFPILGRDYCAAFEDYGGSIDFNDFFVCLVGWSHEG
ncbi:hypothetical protein [Xenorhabdus japonica]|uniref:Uncharacterized protein n=1 Tax=Xenorhabdus japonica TaxID=53341 RepID=A0A1I5B964_9GAMM|nr:hypothetical protein [Xenorhabdus japonica]SFN71059.1 hypothetical protein SAMN05421579_11655 [Xenorhabdus japonica]